MKGNKGITLIALVITIIVLLILAGVSIAMLSGENSILGRAKDSSIQTTLTSAADIIGVKVSEYVTKYYDETYASRVETPTYSSIGAAVAAGFNDAVLPDGVTMNPKPVADTTAKVTLTFNGYKTEAELKDSSNNVKTTVVWSTPEKVTP